MAIGDELIERRTRNGKVFDLGGNSRRAVIGPYAHHQVNGIWVDTICDWRDSTREYLSGQYPYVVKVNKGNLAVSVLAEGETVPMTVAPVGHNRKAVAAYAGNTVTIPGLWTGVDFRVVLAPEQPVFVFAKVAEPCTDPALALTGLADPAPMLAARYQSHGGRVAVPATLQYGTVTYSFADVPLGAEVS